MYSYFYGKIVDINAEQVIIDVHDVGYEFYYIHSDDFKIGSTVKVLLYHVLREDEEYLIGFLAREERSLFEKLITVKGIGPRTAINALRATNTNSLLENIQSGNVNALKKLPGIGSKAASQIILDLKGKLVKAEEESKLNHDQEEAYLALKGLGFKAKEIENVLLKLPVSLSTEELIRESLRRLRK